MKRLLTLFFILPFFASAQNRSDYQQAMTRFQRFYNAGQGDSIHAMFSPAVQHSYGGEVPMWTNASNADLLKKYGRLTSFRFLGIDNSEPGGIYVFETVFTNAGLKTTSLSLDKNARLGTFRFITSSEAIKKMVSEKQ